MPRANPERRQALLDAAIDVLAGQGARGLTFRAVDQKAEVPTGTTSNYFASRDELLGEVGRYVFVRLRPDEDTITQLLGKPRDHRLTEAFMHDILRRVRADRAGYLALLELRLESVRNPALSDDFARTMAGSLRENIDFHLRHDLPGDDVSVTALYLAMTGLIVEELTLPGLVDPDAVIGHITKAGPSTGP